MAKPRTIANVSDEWIIKKQTVLPCSLEKLGSQQTSVKDSCFLKKKQKKLLMGCEGTEEITYSVDLGRTEQKMVMEWKLDSMLPLHPLNWKSFEATVPANVKPPAPGLQEFSKRNLVAFPLEQQQNWWTSLAQQHSWLESRQHHYIVGRGRDATD